MQKSSLSLRQLLALVFTGMTAAALRQLPRQSAAAAQGAGAWLSAVVALPVVLVLCWAVTGVLRGMPKGCGYGETLRGVLGPWLGGGLTIIYMVWTVLILGSGLSQCGERLKVLGYNGWGRAVFLLLALLLAVKMAMGRVHSFARAVEIFFLALTAALVLVVLLAAFRVEPGNLLPVGGGALKGGLPALEVACAGVPAAFLTGWVRKSLEESGRRKLIRWTVWAVVVLTAVQAVCIGAFGWQVTALQRLPLFEAAKQVGVTGAFQRVEALVAALLVMSDVALFGLTLLSLRGQSQALWHGITPDRIIPAAAVLGAGIAFFMSRSQTVVRFLGELLLPCMSIVLGFAVPLIVILVKKIREHFGWTVTSCAGNKPETEDIVAEKKDAKSKEKNQKKC